MTVFLCIDDRGGMLFNHRRQSRDSKLIDDIIKTVGANILYISDFSESLFSDSKTSVISVSDPLLSGRKESFVFVENLHLAPYQKDIDTLIIYKWNKKYPYDFSLDINPEECGYKLIDTSDFAGSSHDKITKEIYRK